MPAAEETPRRSVVPSAAGRSLWRAAVWTGAGTAFVASIVSIAVVSALWLPAAGQDGSARSALRAGILTFLAGLHGGVTVDGLDANFVPLGLTVIIGLLAWRAGAGLADAAADLGEDDPGRLLRALAVQTAAFAAACGAEAVFAPLGSSSVPVVGAVLAGLLLFGLVAAVALLRSGPLGDLVVERLEAEGVPLLPARLARGGRIALAALTVQLAAGCLLVVGSLVLHHDRVETLSRQVGGGWSGIPVLVLGALAAPNAAVAGASYLVGPGFAVGDGTRIALTTAPRGTLPSFPVLGAVPTGAGTWIAWVLAAATLLVTGGCVAALAQRAGDWRARWTDLGTGLLGIVVLGVVLAWQGGGSIGSGRLHAVGPSPWQYGLAAAAGPGAVAALLLAVQWAGERLSARSNDDPEFVPLAGLGVSVASAVGTARASVTSAAAAVVSTVRPGRGDDDETGDGADGSVDEAPVSRAAEPRKGGKLAG